MMFIVVLSILFLPIFLVLRWPFFRLPLHMDTGYYVSNNTICTREIDFSKGWNATYAGCSKVVPEFFYSAIYLVHGGGNQYKFYSRFYYSLYCFAVAPVLGYTAYLLSDGSPQSYLIAFALFCLLASEPHYGIYFESGEQFEILPQAVGFLLIVLGLDSASPPVVGAGIGLWVLESFFIKLSSLPASVVLAVGAGYFLPPSIVYSVMFSVLAFGAYLAWVIHNDQSPVKIVRRLIGHEVHFGHKLSVKAYAIRLAYKVGFLGFICASHPIIPTFALVGLASGHEKTGVVLLYLTAVSVTYMVQACHAWYYSIPFLPAIALLSDFGVKAILRQGVIGQVACGVALLLWLFLHSWWAYGRDLERLNRWTWLPHKSMPEKNLALDRAGEGIRRLIGKRRLLVFGHYSQAYALVESSYPLSLVAPNEWLNFMHPNWKEEFDQKLISDPPEWILDSDGDFNAGSTMQRLGLKYDLVREFDGDFRLYVLDGAKSTSDSTIPH